jgi:hypothetical protein
VVVVMVVVVIVVVVVVAAVSVVVIVVVVVVVVNVVYSYRFSQKPFSRCRNGHTRVISGCYVICLWPCSLV